jgi:hypothetical protein
MPGAKPDRNRWWRKYGRLVSGPLKEFPSGLRHPHPAKKVLPTEVFIFAKGHLSSKNQCNE